MRALIAALVILCTLALSGGAGAKASHSSPYTYRQTFGSAVRLLKVDMGLEVTEKDPDWGYVLFVYTSPESGDRKNEGSFSFVKQNGQVQVTLQIPSMPGYHEQVILDKLKRKLHQEHGDPPPPAKPDEEEDDEDKEKEKDEEGDDEED
jgi:uncharacterized cupredoxin-like copper-binding protein